MKCPFLVIKKDIFDSDGKKTGEEIELQDCIKNDCMIYDGATKLCSLLSSNMKTGVLIDDVKNGIKDLKEEMFQRSESFNAILSKNMQALQESLLGRFDILKKQNEVMVLGFDRLVETINNKFEGIKSIFSELNESTKTHGETLLSTFGDYQNTLVENFNSLRAAVNDQSESIMVNSTRLQSTIEAFKNTHGQFITEVKNFNEAFLVKLTEFGDLGLKNEKANQATSSALNVLNENIGKMEAINQVSLESITAAINRLTGTNQEVLAKLNQLDTLVNYTEGINGALKSEVAGLKVDILNALGNITVKFEELSSAFAETMKPGIDNVTEFMKTEIAGLKTEALNALVGLSAKFDDLGTHINGVKTELAGMKMDQAASLDNVKTAVVQLQELFSQSSASLGSMSDMMKNLNSNYIESLGKIAGLAEGMRKGVDKVGEGMHDSVKDLVKEMKSEIGALEKQYEKTFGDIANLAGKFEDLNVRIKEMTKEVEKEFKDSFGRQETLSEYTKTILEHIKEYFIKEETRYNEEQTKRVKKEGLDHFDRATLYYYRGNFELAVNEINKALEIEETAEYLNLKGLLLTELGRFNESKKTYKRALEMEPELAEIHNNLGMLHLKMKKLDDAVLAFQEAVKKNINYAHAYVNLGSALLELEKFDDAIKAFEKALDIDPSNRDAREAIKLYKEGKIGA
jgi:tetratricopeptide (TPR) repeat protein